MAYGMAALAMLLPALAQGVVLGELVGESRIGEPFRAYVPVAAAESDTLDALCFSLGVPGEEAEGSRHYLLAARLILEGENAARRILILGAKAVNEPFLKLYLQAACGAERASRKYTLLIDPPERPAIPVSSFTPAAPAVKATVPPLPGTTWEMRPGDTVFGLAKAIYPRHAGMRSRLVAEIVRRNPGAFPTGDAGRITAGATLVIPDLRQLSASAPIAIAATAAQSRVSMSSEKPPSKVIHEPRGVAKAEEPLAPPASMQRIPTAGFRLKLSGADLNLSLIGKLTEEQRSFLRERQSLLDADDQTAGFLALKHRVVELEKKIETMRLKMTPAVAAPASPPPRRPQALPVAAPFGSETWQIARYGLTLYLLPFSQIVVAMLALFFIIRHYSGIKERLAARGLLRKGAKPMRRAVVMEPEKGVPPITEFDQRLVIAATPPAAVASPVAPDSVDAILEEAQLYVIHGHPDHAIRLLEEQIQGNRGEVRIWMLLFVIYRSQGMKLEFDKLANRFRNAIRDEELWENIQTLGHELDPENELYLNDRIRAQRAMASSPGALDFTLEGISAEEGGQAPSLDLDLGAPTPATHHKPALPA